MHGQFLYCPATSFRLEAFPSPAWDDRWRQVMDLALYSQALIGGSRIALVHRPSYRYRRHGASATQQNSTSAVRIGEESALCREVGDAARASGWRRASWAARARVTVRLHGLVQVLQQLARLQWRSAARTLGHAVGP